MLDVCWSCEPGTRTDGGRQPGKPFKGLCGNSKGLETLCDAVVVQSWPVAQAWVSMRLWWFWLKTTTQPGGKMLWWFGHKTTLPAALMVSIKTVGDKFSGSGFKTKTRIRLWHMASSERKRGSQGGYRVRVTFG